MPIEGARTVAEVASPALRRVDAGRFSRPVRTGRVPPASMAQHSPSAGRAGATSASARRRPLPATAARHPAPEAPSSLPADPPSRRVASADRVWRYHGRTGTMVPSASAAQL